MPCGTSIKNSFLAFSQTTARVRASRRLPSAPTIKPSGVYADTIAVDMNADSNRASYPTVRENSTDQANEEARMAFEAHLRQSDSHLSRAIEDALARIDRAAFGVCEVCK